MCWFLTAGVDLTSILKFIAPGPQNRSFKSVFNFQIRNSSSALLSSHTLAVNSQSTVAFFSVLGPWSYASAAVEGGVSPSSPNICESFLCPCGRLYYLMESRHCRVESVWLKVKTREQEKQRRTLRKRPGRKR